MAVEQKYTDLYISNTDVIGEGFPLSVNARRRGCIDDFVLCGLPDKSDEKYRLSDMKALFGREWNYNLDKARELLYPVSPLPLHGHKIEVLNGSVFGEELLNVRDNGVIFGSLRAASIDFEILFNTWYNSAAANKTEAVTALNSAFMRDGAFVYVPDGEFMTKPFIIECGYSPEIDAELIFSRMLIVVGRGATADIVIRYRSQADKELLVNHVAEFCIEEGAIVTVTEEVGFGAKTTAVSNYYFAQKAGSKCKTVSVMTGDGTQRINFQNDFQQSYARCELYALYLNGGEQRTDIEASINHLVSDCESHEMVKGIAGGESVGSFTGRVYVAPDAQRTNATQQSRNILMNTTAKIYARPQLEIYADDVKCSHGATVGQLDSEAIYYMRQRGLSEQSARKLQMGGFMNDIISHCSNAELAAYLLERSDEKISKL